MWGLLKVANADTYVLAPKEIILPDRTTSMTNDNKISGALFISGAVLMCWNGAYIEVSGVNTGDV